MTTPEPQLRVLEARGVAKLLDFSGAEGERSAWCFVFQAYTGLLSRELVLRMDEASELEDDPYLHEMAESAKELSRVFFALLVSLVQGKAINILMNTEYLQAEVAWTMRQHVGRARRAGLELLDAIALQGEVLGVGGRRGSV